MPLAASRTESRGDLAEVARIPRPRIPNPESLVSLPSSGDYVALLAVRIVHRPALAVEDHRRALVRREGLPLRQPLVVGIARARERHPGAAHLVRERVAILAVAHDGFGQIDVLEDERDVHAVHGAEAPAAHGRVP